MDQEEREVLKAEIVDEILDHLSLDVNIEQANYGEGGGIKISLLFVKDYKVRKISETSISLYDIKSGLGL